MDFRSAYDRRPRAGMVFGEKGRTKQAMKAECDINLIVASYKRTGTVAHMRRTVADYGFAPAVTLQEALDSLHVAESLFMELPAKVRKRFNNDAGSFLAFVQDPANLDEMVELGIAERKAPAEPDAGQPVPPA